MRRFAFEKFHREEVDVAVPRGSRVNLVDLADVRVTDLAGVANLGRQSLAEIGLGALECDASHELFVDRFVDDPHPAPCNLADDAKAFVEQVVRLERILNLHRRE